MENHVEHAERVAEIIGAAGGTIVGKTKLQKIAYLLELAGLGTGYQFSYHYYGPYSSTLEEDAQIAWAFDLIEREDRTSNWGGKYSIFSVREQKNPEDACRNLASLAAETDAIELELAATAAYLAVEGYLDPWEETKNRKPDKATPTRIKRAKAAYRKFLGVATPRPLPAIL